MYWEWKTHLKTKIFIGVQGFLFECIECARTYLKAIWFICGQNNMHWMNQGCKCTFESKNISFELIEVERYMLYGPSLVHVD